MLKLSKTTTITLPVSIRLPTDDAGTSNEGTLKVRYHLLPQQAVAEMVDAASMTDRDVIDRILVEVIGLGDADGQPISGAEALDVVLNSGWSRHLQMAIVGEYFEHFGQARVKNSRPLRGR